MVSGHVLLPKVVIMPHEDGACTPTLSGRSYKVASDNLSGATVMPLTNNSHTEIVMESAMAHMSSWNVAVIGGL